MPITFGMKGSSQITGCVENAVPLHVDIPRTGGRGFTLPSEDALQEYLQFPWNIFFQFFRSKVVAVNFVLQITPEEKNRKD
jgi:hypothetical protein